MKYLKRFNENSTNNEEIELICKKYDIYSEYTINKDGSVDINGSVSLYKKGLTELPINFGNVSGNFFCHNNQLKSLIGCPKSVGGDFNCSSNQLESLNWSPKEVGGDFFCAGNQLTSLVGCPNSLGGEFDCNDNKLISLNGSPKEVGSDFFCSGNKLKSLEGSPLTISGDFFCKKNNLISLIGISEIKGGIYCSGNPVWTVWNLFKSNRRFIDKINYIYTDLHLGDGWTIQRDIIEQIAEEIDLLLPIDWEDQVEEVGYIII